VLNDAIMRTTNCHKGFRVAKSASVPRHKTIDNGKEARPNIFQ
jgi:hypothetical protein